MRIESLGSLTAATLAATADGAVYGRGQGLLDAVGELRIADGEATATVTGTFPYSVRLTWERDEDGAVTGDCNCPHHASGAFCKYLVAVGLAVLQVAERSAGLAEAGTVGADDYAPDDVQEDDSATAVEAYLNSLDAEQLRELILSLAESNAEVFRSLSTTASLLSGDVEAVAADLLAQAKSVTAVRRFLGYRDAMDYGKDVGDVLNELAPLFEGATGARAAAPALLHITTRLRKQMERNIDDSSGVVGDVCQRAVRLYARACCAGPPEPGKLGRWLAKFRLDSPGWPSVTLAEFLPALGDRGLAVYRRAAAKAEAAAEAEGKDPDFELKRMLLELADHDGDVDRAIQLLSLGEHTQYGAIVERLLAADRRREAMAYLDRAVAEGCVSTNNLGYWRMRGNEYRLDPLRAAELYREDGRDDDALEMARALFRRTPTSEMLDVLTTVAAWMDREEEEREAALAWAEQQSWRSGDQVIALALHVGDVDRAWAAADRWGVGYTWQQLADVDPQPRPDDAIALYRDAIEETLIPVGRKAAREAAALATRMVALAAAADGAGDVHGVTEPHDAAPEGSRVAACHVWLADLRERYRRRPTVREVLDRVGL
ncbi:SWIM zinc finger family protein [Actinomyces ruminicola]|uniref:SWIM-type domain-containing protein n=1 Tax=Actinomyces ruminicola TaxID=332524 RepID=A0A1G9RSW7_9ACTO|nr:hypothetical protein [Actinomyces ruminicola]SDM26311.1 hypothetical protein SAMN04487766_101131 [Actinomyces ruminicola]